MTKISLIIPAKDENKNLYKVLGELKKYKFIGEKIIITDKIDVELRNIAKKYNCKLIKQHTAGFGAAIKNGFKVAKYQYGCIFNADFSFDPKYLPSMIKKTNNHSFVYSNRYNKLSGSDDDTLVTTFGNKIFTFVCRYLLQIKLNDILYTYVLCDTKKFNSLKIKSNDFKLCIELPFNMKLKRYTYCQIPSRERKRLYGFKKVNELKDGFLILIQIIKSFFTSSTYLLCCSVNN